IVRAKKLLALWRDKTTITATTIMGARIQKGAMVEMEEGTTRANQIGQTAAEASTTMRINLPTSMATASTTMRMEATTTRMGTTFILLTPRVKMARPTTRMEIIRVTGAAWTSATQHLPPHHQLLRRLCLHLPHKRAACRGRL